MPKCLSSCSTPSLAQPSSKQIEIGSTTDSWPRNWDLWHVGIQVFCAYFGSHLSGSKFNVTIPQPKHDICERKAGNVVATRTLYTPVIQWDSSSMLRVNDQIAPRPCHMLCFLLSLSLSLYLYLSISLCISDAFTCGLPVMLGFIENSWHTNLFFLLLPCIQSQKIIATQKNASALGMVSYYSLPRCP